MKITKTLVMSIFFLTGCETPAKKMPCCGTVPAPTHLIEKVETYKCSNYYKDQEEKPQTGSFDFFVREE